MELRRILFYGLSLLLFGVIITSVFLSCKHEAEGLNLMDSICFESQILPIFQTSCAISGCHDSPGNESGYVFADYEHIMEAVTPGDPMKSPAYTSLISGSGEEGLMPPGQPLSVQNRTLIRVWIEQGALNESCVQLECDTVSVITFTDHVWPVIELNCEGCHSGASPSGGIPLTDYCEVAILSANGMLAGVLRDGTYPIMPPSGPIPECQIRQIELWIEGDQDTLCTQNPDTTDYYNPRACFQRDILPVLQSSCAISGCHDETTHKEGYIFSDYLNTMEAVQAGNPSESKLYEVITTSEIEEIMPPSPYEPLSPAVIDSIYNWISYGALDEDCGNACDTISTVTFSGIVWPIIELNCRGCHSGSSPSGNVLLTNYNEVYVQATNGHLTGVLRDGTYVLMPPSGPLSECKIRQVEIWVAAESLNNK
jgi:hypothetical protein